MTVSERSGPFWDGVNGKAPLPPAAATLGLEFIEADPDAGTIVLAFTATEAFTNPMGNVLGAFLAAMLYDTVGPACWPRLNPISSSRPAFLRPVRPGRLIGRGKVLHREGDIAHLQADLADGEGALVATATARVIPFGVSAP